jgi:hypothetical protein
MFPSPPRFWRQLLAAPKEQNGPAGSSNRTRLGLEQLENWLTPTVMNLTGSPQQILIGNVQPWHMVQLQVTFSTALIPTNRPKVIRSFSSHRLGFLKLPRIMGPNRALSVMKADEYDQPNTTVKVNGTKDFLTSSRRLQETFPVPCPRRSPPESDHAIVPFRASAVYRA